MYAIRSYYEIIQIAKDNGYDSIFAGYGFMAEDDETQYTNENRTHFMNILCMDLKRSFKIV